MRSAKHDMTIPVDVGMLGHFVPQFERGGTRVCSSAFTTVSPFLRRGVALVALLLTSHAISGPFFNLFRLFVLFKSLLLFASLEVRFSIRVQRMTICIV
jgi:hypothetical protein